MKPSRLLGSFAVAMISVSAILNLRGLPVMAAQGVHAVYFYLAGALGFLIPSALICAELASQYPEDGGIYCWVKRAFGLKTGFIAMWMEWINNVIAYPASISGIVVTFAIAYDPSILQHPWIIFTAILSILWGLTAFNVLDIRMTSKLNLIGALFGTIIPGVVILALGWLYHPPAAIHAAPITTLTPTPPGSDHSNLAIFVSVIGAFSGMQITAFYANSIRTPSKTYPRAILCATVIILILAIAGVLSIDRVIPASELNIVGGVMQCFNQFFTAVHYPFMSHVLGGLLILGMISSLSAWIAGPARGARVAFKDLHFSPRLTKINQAHVPVNILVIQALIATGLTFLFVFFKEASHAFWLLIALTSQFTALMYCLVFAAAIRLRNQRNTLQHTGYQIPGKNIGITLVSCLGIFSCAAAFMFGLNPPASLNWIHPDSYRLVMFLIDFSIIAYPFAVLAKRRNGVKAPE